MSPAPFPILIVEDSDDDLFLFRRVLTKAQIAHPLLTAMNGQAAIDDLRSAMDRDPLLLPRLVFLDLKLPLRTGFEVLVWIRQQPALTRTVVVVLSSSAEKRDVVRAYEMGAQGYFVKYPEPAVFKELIRAIEELPEDAGIDRIVVPGLPRPAR